MSLPGIKIKMCGMTRSEDVAYAIGLGVHAIGLIFYKKSARSITITKAHQLVKDIPPFISPVAVFVNPESELVQQIINELPIHLLQFHGDETPEFCNQFGLPYIKAIHPETTVDIEEGISKFNTAQALLLDSQSTSSRGGSGLTFDWRIIPKNTQKPLILAGGLNELNIADAINSCRPYAVDVCSGIEMEPGIKDHSKMTHFIKALEYI
ncbi:MAG: phosphoribosylanthranilate isomerase [bacterium]|nr:phosphoribosylanthranilate isomerase [bacterium]